MLRPGRSQRRKVFECQELSNSAFRGGRGMWLTPKCLADVRKLMIFICLNQLEFLVLSILGNQFKGKVGLDPNITVHTRNAEYRATKTQKQEMHASIKFSAKYN